MNPYYDDNCKCHKIEKEINEKFFDSNSNWNCDKACVEWRNRKSELKNNNIEFENNSDEYYSCTCPTCGEVICGWCEGKGKFARRIKKKKKLHS